MCQPNVKQMIYIRFAFITLNGNTALMEKKKRKVKTSNQLITGQSFQTKDPKNSQNENDENRLDFGGLPNRNLKKNLGCG